MADHNIGNNVQVSENEDGEVEITHKESGESVRVNEEGLHSRAHSTEKVRATDTTTITVNVPTDFDTIQGAIDDIAQLQLPTGVNVEINIETGHEITNPVFLTDGFYGYISIISEDAVVNVGADFPADTDLLRIGSDGHGPRLNCQIDAQGNCRDGVRTDDNSKITVDENCGVRNAGRRGLYARNSSRINAPFSDFSGAGQEGADCFRNSHINVFNSDLSGATLDCVRGARGGMIIAGEANLTGAGRDAVRTTRLTNVNVYRADLMDAGRNAVRCTRFGIVNAQDCDMRGATEGAVHCVHGSLVLARNDIISDGTNPVQGHGIFASRGGIVAADATTITHCDDDAIIAEFGGRVSAQGADVSNATGDGVHASMGQVYIGLLTANDCGGNPVYTEKGGEVVAERIESSGCPSPVRSTEGGKIVCQDGNISTGAAVDARADDGATLQMNDCITSSSTGGQPHADDVNFTGLDEVNGVIFGDFEV